jgi:bifunctional non-homologous end joining protein LigD
MATRSGSGSGRTRRASPETREQLEEYRRKRDFKKTSEPSGDLDPREKKSGLQFVIQKHAASHLHYDLRLELDGVMRSWSVPKGPSLDPGVKRLALQVEDHPMSYNTFEGTIPEGEYGGGTVMLWDRGFYHPDEMEEGDSEADAVRRGLKAGKLSFTFGGERAQGSFALVRTESGQKPKWLLIKHRDEFARRGVEITDRVKTSVVTGRTMTEIADDRDRVWRSNRHGGIGGELRKSNIGAKQKSDAIAPMKQRPARALPDDGEWTYEPWRGGDRVIAYVAAVAARIVDDAGRNVTRRNSDIAQQLAALAERVERPFVIDGEIVSGDDDSLTFYVCDLLLDGERVLLPEPWSERRAALESLFAHRRAAGVKLQKLEADGAAALEQAAAEGWPGIIARRTDAPYEPGVRSDGVLRIT